MNYDHFIEEFYESLQSLKLISINAQPPIKVMGDDLESIKKELQELEKKNPRSIDKAGTYFICGKNEVLYIGEGGIDKNKEDSGTMGHRVYKHMASVSWSDEIRVIFYVPINPREFSRLGEQLALALHFSKSNNLPKYQKIWR